MMLSSLSPSTCDSRSPGLRCAIERARVCCKAMRAWTNKRGSPNANRRPSRFSAQRPLNSPFRPCRRLASVDVRLPSSAAQRPSPPS
jgi:hypothetical protein